MSEAKKGKPGKPPSKEARRNMSEAKKGNLHGIKVKPFQKSIVVICLKLKKGNPVNHTSEETKRNMSEAKKGEKNPMYGKSPSKETRRKCLKRTLP